MVRLKDKVVVITGASSGIGKATATAFARHGSRLVLAARRLDRLEQLKKHILSLDSTGADCICVKTDIKSERDVKHLFDSAVKAFGRVDILVNNAGRGLHAPIPKTSLEEWQSVLDTNLTGVFLCTKEAVKRMGRLRIKGHIITISSIAGLYGAPQYSAYCASKHGVTGFMRSAKLELRKHGIRTSNIHPARVDTEFFDVYTKRPGRSQMLSPDDIADVVIARAKRNILLIVWVRLVNVIKRIYYPVRYSISK